MTTQRSREAEIEYLDMVKHDSRSKPNRDQASSGLEDDGWLTGFRQLIKEYIMSEPDVARVSNESEAYVLIEEKTEEDMQTEEPAVEEEISVSKVTSEESSISWPAGAESGQVNGQAVEEKRERKRITKNISLTQEEMESDKENDPTQSPTRSSSKRLDLAKYQPMSTDPENKRATVTKRLDTSRFSKFEGDTTDSATPVKVTRNFTISSTGKKANYEKQTNMVTPNSDKCVVCKKTVYPMEKVQADGITYHKTCFRCKECNRVLALGSFAQSKQFLYCKPHFAQLFKLKGNYDEGFDGSSRATRISAIPDSENGFDQADNQQASEEDALQHFEGTKSLKDQFEKGGVSNVTVKKSFEGETITRTSQSYDETTPEDKQVSENEPVLRPDVVRSSDVVDDRAAIRGMRTLRDQFEKGEATQSSPGKSFDFEEEIRAAKEAEVEMNLGQVSESTPVRDENVVRSDVKAEEVKTFSGGIRSLKDRFEKGGVSNIETTPAKPTVEVHSLEDFNPDVTERGVSENTPVVRDDVVRSSQKVEDSFFKAGGARSLKARFEQGNVSNLEEKPKEKIEVTPRSLEDYGQEQDAVDQGGVSENTPVQRDDVVKEGKGEEDPGIKRGAARSLRSLFEKGEVHNIEEKPRAPLERSPKSLDQLAPSTEGVVENEPEVRSDLVRETSARDEPMNIQSGASRSLKDRWEKGEVETAPEKPKEVIDIRGEGQVAESNPEVREDLVRESLEAPEEISVGAGSLRAQWEAGDVTHAESHVEKEELSPKRLSSYYEGEQDETGQEETGQDETGQVEMGQDDMGQVEPRQEEQGEMEEPQEEEVKMEQAQEVEDEMEQPQEVEDEIQPPEEEVETEAVNRYSEEDGNEEPVNGHAQENGFEIEVASPENEEAEPAEDSSTPVETAPGQDIASWEIKAARAAAIQSQDADEDANEYANEDANEEPSKEGGEGLLIEF